MAAMVNHVVIDGKIERHTSHSYDDGKLTKCRFILASGRDRFEIIYEGEFIDWVRELKPLTKITINGSVHNDPGGAYIIPVDVPLSPGVQKQSRTT